jgi:hypothetical protein
VRGIALAYRLRSTWRVRGQTGSMMCEMDELSSRSALWTNREESDVLASVFEWHTCCTCEKHDVEAGVYFLSQRNLSAQLPRYLTNTQPTKSTRPSSTLENGCQAIRSLTPTTALRKHGPHIQMKTLPSIATSEEYGIYLRHALEMLAGHIETLQCL